MTQQYFTKEGDEYKKVEYFNESQIEEIAEDATWLTKRLDRARENERGKFADYDELKTKLSGYDELKTKATDFETQLAAANTKIEDLTKTVGTKSLEVDKIKIVNEFKLSDELAEFVTGDNVEDMRKRAEKLASGVKPSGVHIDKKDKPDEKKSDAKRIAGDLFGRKKV